MMGMARLHPSAAEFELATVLHALSDPQRLRIVQALADDSTPRRCGSFGLDVTKSTLTHHFRVLREAGVIEQHEDGTACLNVLRRDELDARFPGLLDAILAGAGRDARDRRLTGGGAAARESRPRLRYAPGHVSQHPHPPQLRAARDRR